MSKYHQSFETIKIHPEILAQELGDEIVLLDMKNEHYYSLKDSGVLMWQLLNKHSDRGIVKEQLLEEYEVDETTIQRDLDSFISWLVKKDLAQVDTGSHDETELYA